MASLAPSTLDRYESKSSLFGPSPIRRGPHCLEVRKGRRRHGAVKVSQWRDELDVSFFKMKDGSGVSIAKIKGGENAMLALLAGADMDDLDLTPHCRAPLPRLSSSAQTPRFFGA